MATRDSVNQSLAKNFEFKLVDSWLGYNSANDKTNISDSVYVEGSLNVYKKISGNLAVRPGLKRIGEANSAESGVSSEFIWNTSWGATLPMWIADNKLQVRYNGIWYTLLDNINYTRYVFDTWWNDTEKKDRVLFVHGTSDIQHWSGGVATIESTTASVAGVISVLNTTPTTAGSDYSLNDVLTISAGSGTATALVTALYNNVITSVAIPGPGSGYTVGNTLSVEGGQGGTVRVDSVDGGGSILSISIVNSGRNYHISTQSASGGSGTGALVSINSVGTGGIATLQLLAGGSGYSVASGILTSGGTGTGATVQVTSISTSATITKTGSTTWQQDGFSTTSGEKTLIINGIEYTYTGGESTTTLTGVTPDPSTVTPGSVALQSVITVPDKPVAGFNNDFIKVINNQVYVGSYTSRLCYISANDDFTNYTVPTPRTPGSPELLTLDATLNGIGVRTGKAYISIGSGEWAVISFTDITVGDTLTQQTTVDVKPIAKLAAAYAHEFIANSGDNIIYLSKDQQVRTFGDFNNSFVAAYPSLSQQVSTELMAENFSGGGLKCIGDFTYLTAPASGKTYLYQVREAVNEFNQVVSERLWHAPFTWNATRVDEINGEVVAFSNANPQVYQVWDTGQWHDDSPSDEPLPYSCVLAHSYRGKDRRQGLWTFDKVFTDGYATPGTLLNLTVNYNYRGITNNPTVPINSIERPTTFFTPSVGSLGDSSLGDKPLGQELFISSESDDVSKFKNINSLPLINCFEYQLIYSSDTVDANWEILANGTNAHVDNDQDATFLINKQRN